MSAAKDELEMLLEETRSVPASPAPVIQKVHYTHDAMIDMIIAQPWISQNELAARFRYSASWVSQVIASDAFQARLAERSNELVDPTIKATVEENFRALVLRSMDILRQKLDKPVDEIPDNLAVRTFELATRAAGYGAKVDQTPPVQKQEVHVHLEQLGDGLVNLLRRKKAEAILGDFTDVSQAEG